MNRESGQMTIEMILILSMLLGFSFLVANEFKQNELFAGVISKPWQSIAGLLENGQWAPPEQSRDRHPGSLKAHNTVQGEDL
jgi:hypothetical protein